MTRGYEYRIYRKGINGNKRQFIMEVSANSMNEAIKKAGFDWVEESDGKIVKSRKGIGYTNSKILVYMPEDVAANAAPEFVFERII